VCTNDGGRGSHYSNTLQGVTTALGGNVDEIPLHLDKSSSYTNDVCAKSVILKESDNEYMQATVMLKHDTELKNYA
jgi:hypothetical protein